MNEPHGKEENRYYHHSETYRLPNRKLEAFIKQIKEDSSEANKPALIQISGGSCVGKSTFIKEITENLNNSLVIHQDDYQLGKDFSERKTSKYKYDDPRNFQIEKVYTDMQRILSGDSIEVPEFDLAANISSGSKEASPSTINILEGVYASYDKLANLSKYKIYIEAPYYLRFLRRISRFVNSSQNVDLGVPLKHMTGMVYYGHKDHVKTQKGSSDLVLQAEEVMPSFDKIISNKEVSLDKVIFKKSRFEIGLKLV